MCFYTSGGSSCGLTALIRSIRRSLASPGRAPSLRLSPKICPRRVCGLTLLVVGLPPVGDAFSPPDDTVGRTGGCMFCWLFWPRSEFTTLFCWLDCPKSEPSALCNSTRSRPIPAARSPAEVPGFKPKSAPIPPTPPVLLPVPPPAVPAPTFKPALPRPAEAPVLKPIPEFPDNPKLPIWRLPPERWLPPRACVSPPPGTSKTGWTRRNDERFGILARLLPTIVGRLTAARPRDPWPKENLPGPLLEPPLGAPRLPVLPPELLRAIAGPKRLLREDRWFWRGFGTFVWSLTTRVCCRTVVLLLGCWRCCCCRCLNAGRANLIGFSPNLDCCRCLNAGRTNLIGFSPDLDDEENVGHGWKPLRILLCICKRNMRFRTAILWKDKSIGNFIWVITAKICVVTRTMS